MALALVGIGSNVGARSAQLDEAVKLLSQTTGIELRAASRLHETLPVGGPPGQGPFLNGAVLVETSLAPETLLQTLHEIENGLGRQRDVRWQARTIDLDLLMYDHLQIALPTLSIPHPRFAFRRFVIEPAAEIAPDLVHPTIGWTMARLRDHLRHARPYVAIAGPAHLGKTRLAHALAEHFAGHRIDSPRLPPTGPAAPASGRALAWELELLGERGSLLASRTWSDETALAVSDFWFDQSLAYGRLRLDAHEFIELRTRHQALTETVVPPKLVVVLTPSTASPSPADRLKHLFRWLIGPGTGPVLELPAGDADPDYIWGEVSAAVAAMS
ncbi:MAG TPA: 2-amino-4-hydroxy-6-hydroxymethyldihydropteridine diphosphokinase [Pirellulales bacterium]|jgi:2-amino-4-hydroxy-6-hydroxymethyldihydropteridine diphosphokinase|nr:2-amino-4-hydroxy-6-hydroxymethyldihydropteridine diphosphokinase [Pirellulales bacterium]